jgi:hypothetical protein
MDLLIAGLQSHPSYVRQARLFLSPLDRYKTKFADEVKKIYEQEIRRLDMYCITCPKGLVKPDEILPNDKHLKGIELQDYQYLVSKQLIDLLSETDYEEVFILVTPNSDIALAQFKKLKLFKENCKYLVTVEWKRFAKELHAIDQNRYSPKYDEFFPF